MKFPLTRREPFVLASLAAWREPLSREDAKNAKKRLSESGGKRSSEKDSWFQAPSKDDRDLLRTGYTRPTVLMKFPLTRREPLVLASLAAWREPLSREDAKNAKKRLSESVGKRSSEKDFWFQAPSKDDRDLLRTDYTRPTVSMGLPYTRREMAKMHVNEVARIVVDVAYKVHTNLGPGLLESVYEVAMEREIKRQGLAVKRQFPVAIRYEDLVIDEGFRADLIVEDCLLVELKSIEALARVHFKQTLTYCRLLDYRLGLLINFGAPLIKDGIRRVVNGRQEDFRPTSL